MEKLHFLLDDHKLRVREKFKDVVFKFPAKKPNRILLKETLNLYLNRLPLPDTFDIDGEPVSDPIVISNAFCKHYSSIAVHLASKIPQSAISYAEFLTGDYPAVKILYPTTESEVRKIISSLTLTRTTGLDGFGNIHLKKLKKDIVKPITKLINKSFQTGKFPDALKIAKILPTYKSKERNLINNYRPISVLPALSKIFDRVVKERLFKHMRNLNILYESQYGYKHQHSTVNAITEFVAKTLHAFSRNETTLAVFLDLIKLFDTLNHEILLGKLRHYGIRGRDLKWFRSFLTNRQKIVVFKDEESDVQQVAHGVPEGSPLSPLLLLIYINDLPQVLSSVSAIHYADDTILHISGQNLTQMFSGMNADLAKLVEWTQANKLSFHLGKTNYMLFYPKPKEIQLKNHHRISIGATEIERKKTVKYLSFHLDEYLEWLEHFIHLEAKLTRSIELMESVRDSMRSDYKVQLYYKIFNNPLSYGIVMWGLTVGDSKLKKFFNLQKRIVKMIGNPSKQMDYRHLYTKYNILRVQDILELDLLKFMFLFHNGRLPRPVTEAAWGTPSHCHYISNANFNDKNVTDTFPSDQLSESFIYRAPRLWSKLREDFKNLTNIRLFAGKYRSDKFQKY